MSPIVICFPWESGWNLAVSLERAVDGAMWDFIQTTWLPVPAMPTWPTQEETGIRAGSHIFRWTPPAGAFAPNAEYIARVHDMDKLGNGRPSVVAVIDFVYRG